MISDIKIKIRKLMKHINENRNDLKNHGNLMNFLEDPKKRKLPWTLELILETKNYFEKKFLN